MRRVGNIYEKIASKENIEKALHKAHLEIEKYLSKIDLKTNKNWQVFRLDKRFLDFLGYRFYRKHITLRKRNFLRISRRIKKKDELDFIDAATVISHIGWIKHCNSHKYRLKYIRPNVSILKCKKVISEYSSKYLIL